MTVLTDLELSNNMTLRRTSGSGLGTCLCVGPGRLHVLYRSGNHCIKYIKIIHVIQ